MVNLFLHIGQCGNQVGQVYLQKKKKNFSNHILIDSEPKVIKSIPNVKNYVYEQSGCGNNWATGYSSIHLLKKSLQLIRREIEKHEYIEGIIVLHSLGGGTGSGLGSHLIEKIRSLYPDIYILSIAIFPFSHGETPLQYYNTCLSISHLQKYADGVLMFMNDELIKKKQNYNEYIADCLIRIIKYLSSLII